MVEDLGSSAGHQEIISSSGAGEFPLGLQDGDTNASG